MINAMQGFAPADASSSSTLTGEALPAHADSILLDLDGVVIEIESAAGSKSRGKVVASCGEESTEHGFQIGEEIEVTRSGNHLTLRSCGNSSVRVLCELIEPQPASQRKACEEALRKISKSGSLTSDRSDSYIATGL